MNRNLGILILTVAVLLGFLVGLATGAIAGTNNPHLRTWLEATNRGLIHGDAAYYYTGQATQDEINHALLTAILTMDLQHIEGVTPIYPCPPGSTIDQRTQATGSYQFVYATSSPEPDPGYTRAVGFDHNGNLEYMFTPPPIGTYGPADIHVICHG